MINLRVLGKELAGDGKDAAPEFVNRGAGNV